MECVHVTVESDDFNPISLLARERGIVEIIDDQNRVAHSLFEQRSIPRIDECFKAHVGVICAVHRVVARVPIHFNQRSSSVPARTNTTHIRTLRAGIGGEFVGEFYPRGGEVVHPRISRRIDGDDGDVDTAVRNQVEIALIEVQNRVCSS